MGQHELHKEKGATVSQRPDECLEAVRSRRAEVRVRTIKGSEDGGFKLFYHRKLNGVGVILKEEYVTLTLTTPTEA